MANDKRLAQELEALNTQKSFLEDARVILDTSLDAGRKQGTLDEIDEILFNNTEFAVMSLDSNNLAKLMEYQKASIGSGVKPQMDQALRSIQKKSLLPIITKEVQILEALELSGQISKRDLAHLEHLRKKQEQFQNIPDDIEEVGVKKELVYTKVDPDEVYKDMDVAEMESKVFDERVADKEATKKAISESKAELDQAIKCRIGGINSGK